MSDVEWTLAALLLGVPLVGLALLRWLLPRGHVTFQREFASYLRNPVGWVVLVLLYVFRGFEIAAFLKLASVLPVDTEQFATSYMQTTSSFLLMVLVPAILTMRSFAEERRTGSLEVLLTAPVRDVEVVVGKWAAAFGFFAVLWLPSLVVLLILMDPAYLGAAPALGPVLAGYAGVLLVGAMFLAVGVFASSLTDNQLLSSLSSMLFAFALLLGPRLAAPYLAPAAFGDPSGEPGAVGAWLVQNVALPLVGQIDVFQHLSGWFFRGIVNTAHLAFYLGGTVCFLFLTVRALEVRRWR